MLNPIFSYWGAHAFTFFCLHLKWSLLFPSSARYIPNMKISSFDLRYQSGKFPLVLLVASVILSCPGFVHFHFPRLHFYSTMYHALLSGARQPIMIFIKSSHSYIASWIWELVSSISSSDWIMSQSSTYLNLTNCDISSRINLQNWCQSPDFKVLRILKNLYLTKVGVHNRLIGRVPSWSAWTSWLWCLRRMWY